jgi:hypothetical protein
LSAVAIQLDCLPAFGGAEGDQGFVAPLLAMTAVATKILKPLYGVSN